MSRDLHEKLGAMTPENLFAKLDPPALTGKGTIAHGAAAAEYKRGSLMAKGADGKLILFGSDVDDTGTFSGTGDGTAKVFTVIAGGDPTSVLTEVKVDGTAVTAYVYNPVTGEITFETAPANTKAIAIKYTVGGGNPDCVLAEDIAVGTTNDENALVYIAGCFNESELIVAEGYAISAADRDTLRMKGIILADSQPENVM